MKKQILILTFFVAAILAGTSNVFGQLNPGITATQPIPALSCVGTSIPLHPFPGTSYTYTMDGSTGAELADTWTWFATKDPDFITGGVLNTAAMIPAASLLGSSANYGVATQNANSVDITWPADILAETEYQGTPGATPSPTFVVGYATGVNCADNIQVYEINPRFNFTVDIANIDPSTLTTLNWDDPTEQCVDLVQSAVYNNGTKQLDMDYGTNTLYFEVAAANFVNDWTPTFRLISGLVTTQTAVVTLHGTLADAQADANVLGTTNWTAADVGSDWAVGTAFTAVNASDVVSGVSLFVKVVISNLTEESLTDNVFSLAVDAIDDGGAGQWDMEEDDCVPATASDSPDQADYAEHTVSPRPTIIMDGGAMSEPSGVTPEDVITKTP